MSWPGSGAARWAASRNCCRNKCWSSIRTAGGGCGRGLSWGKSWAGLSNFTPVCADR